MIAIFEKLLPVRLWKKPALKPDEVWSALAGTTADNPTYRAVLHLAQDRYMTNMQAAMQCRRDDPKRSEHLERAWEMAEFITQCEEDREAAPAMLKQKAQQAAETAPAR